jgi:hypothetical protein
MKIQNSLTWLIPLIGILTLFAVGILTIMLALVGVMVIWQTIMQVSGGIQFSTGELVGKIGSWIVMGGIAVWLSIAFLRNLPESEKELLPQRTQSPQGI